VSLFRLAPGVLAGRHGTHLLAVRLICRMHPDTIDINIDLPGGCMPASQEAASGGPLDGIRVLDLSSVVMGPLATQILGDLGADVITVQTRDGDINRIMGSGPCPGLSGVSLNLLRNKRNISLDIAHPDGRAAAADRGRLRRVRH
jgi:hypothetical protein